MSNASRTPPSAALPGQHAAGSSSESHDSATLPQALPQLAVDVGPPARAPEAEKHPKGKRKRTAAKDKMILEEAYKKNPKPDKQARLEIVDRVSLNEKEVQIWFQNRRQNDRRKSRPLSPEELAALRYGAMQTVSSDPVSSRGAIPPGPGFPVSDADGPGPHRPSVSPSLNNTSPHHSQSSTDASTPRHGSQESNAKAPSETSPQQSHQGSSSQRSQGSSDAVAHSFSSSVGYLANRWNLGSSFFTASTPAIGGDNSHRLEHFPPSSCSSDTTHNASRSQSHVRLSLSLEGKAELVSSQPSPPREPPLRPASALPGPAPARRGGLQRSHSALPSVTLPPISALTSSLPRLIRGRSRDVHAWESCAESDRRDELTTQAEHESSGSAIAAISLLRSSSGVLQPSAAKRNASVARPQQLRQAKRAKLGRASSTYARLENVDAAIEKRREGPHGKAKDAMLASPVDSDKENWSPDEDGNPRVNPRRRPLPGGPLPTPQNARRQDRVLQEQKGPALLGGRANTAPPRRLKAAEDSVDIFEDSEKRAPLSRDDEVERFMRGEISPSKKGDMDCVAGLLSLSQGAWR